LSIINDNLKSKKAIKYRAVKIRLVISVVLYNLSTIVKECGKLDALFLKTQAVGGFQLFKKVHKKGTEISLKPFNF